VHKYRTLWLTGNLRISKPVAGLLKGGELVLKAPEGRWPVLLIQFKQQFRTPGCTMVRPAADEAGYHHTIEKHVKATWCKAAKFTAS
jgi:hypothetical protein